MSAGQPDAAIMSDSVTVLIRYIEGVKECSTRKDPG